jgi:O-antigen ligase
MTAASERQLVSALIAKLGVFALVLLPIVAGDEARQFWTPANDLGFVLFENWWKLADAIGLHGFGWAKFNTIEVLIVVSALACVWWDARTRNAPVFTFELFISLPFLAAVAAMFVWGLDTGGKLEPALWQVRPYLQLIAIGFLVPQVVRTPADLKLLLGWTLGAIVLKALLVIAIFFFLAGGHFSDWRELVGHEDSVFFVAALCFLFAYLVYERGFWRRIWPLIAGPLLLVALILNLRRAGYVALAMNAALLPIILAGRRRAALALVIGCGIVAAGYLALFWNAEGALGLPAEKIRSVVAGGDASDISSNVYRASENLNLWHTVRENPFGTGFGKPFDKVYAMADISQILPNWDYHPHNMIFGLWMQLGSIGFTLFLFFYSGLLISATYAIRQAGDAFGRSAAVFCTTALTSGLLVSNLDQFIWTQRGALFLGAVMGLVAAISAMQGRRIAFVREERAAALAAPE